jgi:hypothetical protein
MKNLLILISAIFLFGCSTSKTTKDTKDSEFEKFFSEKGLKGMKENDKLGSIEAPFMSIQIEIINRHEDWKNNLSKVFPEGYWVQDGTKLTNGNESITVPNEDMGLSIYLVPSLHDQFLKNHKRLYFNTDLVFKPTELWLNQITKENKCELSKDIATLPSLKIIVDSLWYPTHSEFIKKFCPEILDLKIIKMNTLVCKRVKKSDNGFLCKWP